MKTSPCRDMRNREQTDWPTIEILAGVSLMPVHALSPYARPKRAVCGTPLRQIPVSFDFSSEKGGDFEVLFFVVGECSKSFV